MPGLLDFPDDFPSALPETADLQYRGASFWQDIATGRRGSRFAWWVPRDDINDFCRFVAGHPVPVESTWGVTERVVPLESPVFEGEYAVGIDQAELGGNSRDARLWSGAWIPVRFEKPSYQVQGSTPYMTVRESHSVEAMTIPGRYVRVPSGHKLNQDATILIPGIAYLVTLYQVPKINRARVQAALKAPVNSTTLYLDNGLEIAPGHAFYEGLEGETGYLSSGEIVRTVTHKWRFRELLTYNQIFHPIDGSIVEPIYPWGGPPNLTSDHNLLFA